MICYVCQRPIGNKPSVKISGGLERHETCRAGSYRWRLSDVGKASKNKGVFNFSDKLPEVSMKDMLEEYNQLTGKKTKRFASREAGLRQLEKARRKYGNKEDN